MMTQKHLKGFTIIEMLLVIGVIAICVCILFPKFKAASHETTGNTVLPKNTQAGMIHKTNSKE